MRAQRAGGARAEAKLSVRAERAERAEPGAEVKLWRAKEALGVEVVLRWRWSSG